jgi:hypothetical protein
MMLFVLCMFISKCVHLHLRHELSRYWLENFAPFFPPAVTASFMTFVLPLTVYACQSQSLSIRTGNNVRILTVRPVLLVDGLALRPSPV